MNLTSRQLRPPTPLHRSVQARFQIRPRLSVLLAAFFLLAGCASGQLQPTPTEMLPSGSCSLGLPEGISDEEAIQAVLDAEGELVVEQDITSLMALWSDESYVADAKNTAADENDDQRWIDKDAIRHRYVRTVFPGAPSEARPADLTIQIDGDRAVVASTTNIGSETAPAGDRWELRKVDGCWQIRSLTYNLEAND